MCSTTGLRPHIIALSFVAFAAVIGASTPVRADEIRVAAGYLSVEANPGPLILAGERGFSARLNPQEGVYLPAACNRDPLNCLPGTTVRLDAAWSDLDLPGSATLDGVTYTPLGSSGPNSIAVRFEGAVMLPPLADSATVSAPVTFTGRFAHQPAGSPVVEDTLSGSGHATLTLTRLPFFPQSWFIAEVVYRLESSLPAPWSTTDVGDVGIRGAASFLDGSFFVAGAGADIWGGADAFHFVYQPLAGDAEIVARVVNQQDTHQFAKAALMMRETLDPASLTVILDVKPDGGVEFMVRSNAGAPMTFIAGGSVTMPDAWLRLQKSQNQVMAFTSPNGTAWTELGTVLMPVVPSAGFVGLAVTSHDTDALNLATFDHVAVSPAVTVQNLLQRGGFEEYQPPALGLPGWLSDDFRQVAAKSESNQPHSGTQNGACWTTTFLDCGMFQTVEAPATGIYMLTFYATADRPGGLIGANVDGVLAATSNIEVRAFGDYGPAYPMTFSANRGQTIVVWMYSPAAPGYVVIDDVVLTALPSVAMTGVSWATMPFTTAATFTLLGTDVLVVGRYDAGAVEAFSACPCVANQVIRLNSTYENPVPQTDVSFAAGSAVIRGTSYPFVEFGGSVTFTTDAVTLPGPDLGGEFPQVVSVSMPFTFTGELKGFEVLGLRDPRLVFDLPVNGRGQATLDLLAAPSGSMQFYRIRYEFEP